MNVAVYHAPEILRVLCGLAGMGVFTSVLFWLSCRAFGYTNRRNLRATIFTWLARLLCAVTLFSLGWMFFQGDEFKRPVLMLPEISILILLLALYLLAEKQDALAKMPVEILKIAGVLVICAAGWAVSLGLGWVLWRATEMVQGPEWLPIFTVGLMWVGLIVFLQRRMPDLKLGSLLWPIMLGCLLLMLPDLIEHWANSPKVQQFLHPSPPMIRV